MIFKVYFCDFLFFLVVLIKFFIFLFFFCMLLSFRYKINLFMVIFNLLRNFNKIIKGMLFFLVLYLDNVFFVVIL